MNKIEHELFVRKVESEGNFVRVTANFYEGGTPTNSRIQNAMTFLAGASDQPRVNQYLKLTIEEAS